MIYSCPLPGVRLAFGPLDTATRQPGDTEQGVG